MTNILLVDDEPLVLLTIKSLCRWEDYGVFIAAEAANGKAALEVIRTNPGIDIAVVDVDMPVMNGIEFAEALRLENLNPALVFLSSYSNFEYVRGAFKSGACEYILKSELDEHSLLDVINRISRDRFQKQETGKQGRDSEEKRSVFFDAVLGNNGADLESLFNQSAFTLNWPFYFLILRPGDLLMVHQRYENRLYDFQKTVADLLGRIVVRFSGDCGSLSYDQYYIFMKSAEKLDTAFEMFYNTAWIYIDTGFEKKTGGPASDPASFKELFSRCLAGFLPPSRLVIRSRRYIREHYGDPDLDLMKIAACTGVSKNHLSFEFSRETGETVSDFLTRTRIKQAEKLIMETNLKMYEIAEKTGYQNVETFIRAFKRITGKSPSRFI
ncbi:MAG: response regulator [Treponema sp.]|jgi:two-component system response regulator YesN|nr:response regulator [Treponema sp.]